MPRYLVERTFPDGLDIPVNDQGADLCLTVVATNAQAGVTWVHSYVSDDKRRTFCVYDAPSPEAIRQVASATGCPSTGSPRSACSIPTSTAERRAKDQRRTTGDDGPGTRVRRMRCVMKIQPRLCLGLAALSLLAFTSVALAGWNGPRPVAGQPTNLVDAARAATERFRNVEAAKAAGYGLFHGCGGGPQEGAMGVHLVNNDLVGDGQLDPMRPEALLYEPRNGQMQLVGVEYVVLAEAWHARNPAPPVLMGQLFHYVGSPNRYGIPAFYELHVWAWKRNPGGTFAGFNPAVSCDDYTPDTTRPHTGH